MTPSQPQDHFDQEEEEWSYQAGNETMQYSSSRRTWSSSSQFRTTISQPAPPMLPSSSFQDMHNQMHANAMAMHQNMIQNNMGSMSGIMHEAQIDFGQPQARMQLPTASARQAITSGAIHPVESSDEDSSEEDSSSEDHDAGFVVRHVRNDSQKLTVPHPQHAANRALQDRHATNQVEAEKHRQTMEKRYNENQKELVRQGNMMNERLRMLEDKHATDRTEQKAKDREMEALRKENQLLTQQRHEEAERHRREMADLARAHANRPQASDPVIDTSALEALIRDVQARQLSKVDIEKVIQERVESQLAGLAKQKDVDKAGSAMKKALQAVPVGASIEDVQRAVNKELGTAVDKLATKLNRAQLEARHQQPLAPSQAKLPSALEAPLVVVEEPTHPSHAAESTSSALVKKHRSKGKERAIENVEAPSERRQALQPPIVATNRTEPPPSSALAKVKKQKKSTNCLVPAVTVQPTEGMIALSSEDKSKSKFQSWLVKTPKKPKANDHAASLSALETPEQTMLVNTIPTPGSDALVKVGKHNKKVVPSSTTESVIAGSALIQRAKDKRDEAAQAHSRSMLDATSIPNSQKALEDRKEAREPVQALTGTVKHRKSSKPSMESVTLADIQANISSNPLPGMVTGLELPDDFPENASQISTWERGRAAAGRSTLTGSASKAQIQSVSGNTVSGKQLVPSNKPAKNK